MMIVVQEVLQLSGDFGPAQWLMLSLFCLVNILSAFHYFAQTFITVGSDLACLNVTSSAEKDSSSSSSSTISIPNNFHTLTTELGWQCDEEWKAALVQSMFFVGSMIGTMASGVAADYLGRRPTLVMANLLAVAGNMLTAYLIPSLGSLAFGRLVAGLAVDSNFFMMYIIVMEYISPGMRTIGLNLCIGVWYCVGCMATPWLAIACQDWRTFLTVISLPMLLVPVCAFFVPESAQWLLSRGREDDAIDCFRTVAAINRKKFPVDFISKIKTPTNNNCSSLCENSAKVGDIRGLFATPMLRKKTCILIFKTMVLTLCYDAISRNIQGLGYDPFTMFTITSATIFPACLVILLLQDRVGRKAIAVSALLLTGLLNLTQGTFLALSKEFAFAGAIVAICSRFAVNIAYNSGTQYAAELIPTQVRGQGLSAIHVVGYIAAFFSPQVLYTSNAWIATPEVILGVLSILGAVFCMFLPETLGRNLPVTLADGELFGENDKFWEFCVKPIEKTEDVSSKL